MANGLELDCLDSAKYLYLRDLSEPGDNSLRLVVQEAVVNPGGVVRSHPKLPALGKIINDISPIESTQDSRSYELTWKHYVAYLVTGECVGSCGGNDDESFSGKLFRVYTKSHFLEHLARDTGGHTEPIQASWASFIVPDSNPLIANEACNSPELPISKNHAYDLRVS